ncbi:anti-repressor SinI family protein [Rossellomorea aquimaris]|nr:anti-repressor SinI family protein [Rossellomorea aquimaris]MCA1055140.1 anti-repressor SinI family protein [Rossellomorea aquimaris]
MDKELDLEWVELIKEAFYAGISKEEIRDYLESNKNKETKYKAV